MANAKNIALAFLDGLSPLDALFGPVERPGSRDNLIDNGNYPAIEGLIDGASMAWNTSEAVRLTVANTLAMRLRTQASDIETRALAYKESKSVESLHGH